MRSSTAIIMVSVPESSLTASLKPQVVWQLLFAISAFPRIARFGGMLMMRLIAVLTHCMDPKHDAHEQAVGQGEL